MHYLGTYEGSRRLVILIIIALLTISLFTAGFLGYMMGYKAALEEINVLRDQIRNLKQQITDLKNSINLITLNLTAQYTSLNENISLSEIYEQVRDSVVLIRGFIRYSSPFGDYYSKVQGSGFVYNFTGRMVIITNYHVVYNAVNITVTFSNGNAYAAHVLGYDPYVDLAVLSADAPESEYHPIEIVNSSTLKVGDLVITVGNPFGLSGSMSVGVVSALGRTITEDITGGYPIANIIQTTAPLNPGNSGGPLLNLKGQVVGVATAIVLGSQGIGFAIPSNTILREIKSLIEEGSYDRHPWLGASGIDMTYEIANAIGTNITYGWLITQVVSGGPADKAGLRGGTRIIYIAGQRVVIGGDIIIAVNDRRITGIDDLSSYLEEYTMPGQRVNVTIVRENELMRIEVELGSRPPPS
ncbi:MAG: trypsin-like peptidase domain-containing protein [Candidatus Bathyarchaeia archaeon]